MVTAPDRSGQQPLWTEWVPWLQAGLTAMLAVLFLVMVGKTRQQSTQLRQLQERVEGLENSRALERTTALEQQLRSTAERLQVVERSKARLAVVSSDNARLRQELEALRQPSSDPPAPGDGLRPQAPPPLPPVRP
jgi:uncharacterized protein YlxW (UPF0749 family)